MTTFRIGRLLAFALSLAFLIPTLGNAQQTSTQDGQPPSQACGTCENGCLDLVTGEVTYINAPKVGWSILKPVEDLSQQLAADRPSERAAVRARVNTGCGSGSVCGRFKTGSLILTNAHVTGTRPGQSVRIDCVIDGARRTYEGKVIMAAYSDRTLTDWSVVYVEGLTEIEPVKLSKDKPRGKHYTRGSPRCVWPLVSTDILTADISDGSPLWRWRPNSIGGQSGSGVWSYEDHQQYGLLTWSWGGLGAGQQTAEIYRQAKERTVSGAPRIDDLKEVGRGDVVVENGYFAQAGIDELPIWAGDDDGGGGVDPDPDFELTAEEMELVKTLRKRSAELGVDHIKALQLITGVEGETDTGTDGERRMFRKLRDRAKEKSIDFVRLIELILQIIELLRDSETSIDLPQHPCVEWSYSLTC